MGDGGTRGRRRTQGTGAHRRSMVVGSAADLLAAVPVALGFVPTQSVVMLSLGPGVGPHARVDLGGAAGHPAMAECLVGPAVRHGVERVALVIFSAHDEAPGAARALRETFARAGVEVAALLGADGRTWLSWLEGSRTTLPREYDSLSHRFVANAVLAGQAVLGSREELVRRLAPDPLQVRAVARAGALAGNEPRLGPDEVTALLAGAVRSGELPGEQDVAVLRRAILQVDARDACWGWVQRADVGAHLDLWTHVVRSCARGEAAVEGSVLGFLAWLAGDGALAWCALDRAAEGGSPTSLSRLVADLLERAVTPQAWQPLTSADPSAGTGLRDTSRKGPANDRAPVIALDERRGRRAAL